MKNNTNLYVGTVEIDLGGYTYNHSWLIPALSKGFAEIFMEDYIEKLYINIDEFEYSICGIYEIEKRYCEEIKHLLPMLPCKNL